MDESDADPVGTLSDADRSSFGFDRPEDELIARVRSAADPIELGRIGAYELLSIAGTGGQGVVYKARQQGTGREVALKRVLAGSWAGDAARARFAREIEADAALRHPNIVTVYGVEQIEGQPLLAMEWIDGEPIDRWARWHAPPGRESSRSDGPSRSIQDVLKVFLKVCDGVQHAHQRGVIHRDLKPSNILVDAAGEPRVLDFGLAKLTGSDSGPRSRLTASGGFLGTLAYSAPEQVRGDPDGVDVRTDVYALGCVLYQCLTGRAPFGGRDAGGNVEALSRAICHDDPARLSSLRPGLDRDLDAIVAKAIAKDRAHRYQSVDALAADVRRFTTGEPVEARRGVRWYVLGKTIRRHRVPAAIVAGFALVVGAGAVTSLALWRTAETERAEAERGRRQAEAVADVLRRLLAATDQSDIHSSDLTVEQLLAAASATPPVYPGMDPEVEATVYSTLGHAYRGLRLLDQAETYLNAAMAIRGGVHSPDHPAMARSLLDRAWLLHDRGNTAECEHTLERALALQRAAPGTEPADLAATLYLLARVRGAQDQSAMADVVESLRLRSAVFPEAHPLVIECLYLQSDLLHDPAEQLAVDGEILRRLRVGYGPDHPVVAEALHHLSSHTDDPGERDRLGTQAEEIYRRALGVQHRRVAYMRRFRADNALQEGRLDDAERLLREALREYEPAPAGADQHAPPGEDGPREDPMLAILLHHLADVRRAAGDFAEARSLGVRSVAMYRAHPDWSPAERAHAIDVLLQALTGARAHDQAAALALEEAGFLRTTAPSSRALTRVLALAGRELLASQRYEQSEPVLRECLKLRQTLIPEGDPESWLRFNTMSMLGESLSRQGAAVRQAEPERARTLLAEAEPLLLRGYEGMRGDPHAFLARVPQALERLVDHYEAAGAPERAAEFRALLAAAPTPTP